MSTAAKRAANARWRKRNPEAGRASRMKYQKAHPEYSAAYTAGYRAWIAGIKLTQGCVDCGYRKCAAALHFDHVQPGKRSNVSRVQNRDTATAEMALCVVRCANCHAERHDVQRQRGE